MLDIYILVVVVLLISYRKTREKNKSSHLSLIIKFRINLGSGLD